MLRLLFRKPGEHFIHGALKFGVVLSCFAGIYHFKQGSKVFLVLRGLVPDVADQGGIEKPFGLHPKILCGFFAVALGVGDDGVYQLQDVLFAVQVGERVIPLGAFGPAVHRQPFHLCKQDVVFKYGVDVRRNVFWPAP